MKTFSRQLWTLLFFAFSSEAASVETSKPSNSPCSKAQTLAAMNFSAEDIHQHMLDFSERFVSPEIEDRAKNYPDHKTAAIHHLLNLTRPEAQQFFLRQSRTICHSVKTLATQENLFLMLCRSLGHFSSSMRSCLQINCALILDPELSYQNLVTLLMENIQLLAHQFALPHLQHCPQLTIRGKSGLNQQQQATLQNLFRLQKASLFTRPTNPENNSIIHGADDNTTISDPLDLAWLVETNPRLAAAVNTGCFLSTRITHPKAAEVFIKPECGGPARAVIYTDSQGYPQNISQSPKFTFSPAFFLSLLSLGATAAYFWPKKPLMERFADQKTRKLKTPEGKKNKKTQAIKRSNRLENPFKRKNTASFFTPSPPTENSILKRLAAFYVFAEYIHEHHPDSNPTKLLADFYEILNHLPFAFDMDMSEVRQYAEPLRSFEGNPLEQWNTLLASAVIACERQYPETARSLSGCYFLPADFPAKLYELLTELKTALGENHSLGLQGSALANYARSADLDLVITWNQTKLDPDAFLRLLNTIFSHCKISRPYHNKEHNIYVYKITLGDDRKIDLAYVPQNLKAFSPLFTSAEGKFTLGQPGGIHYTFAYAHFLATNEIQFSSETAKQELEKTIDNLKNQNMGKSALEQALYALNHLSKAKARGYTISEEIITVMKGLAERSSPADLALNDLISQRHHGNSGRIFQYMQEMEILKPNSSLSFRH